MQEPEQRLLQVEGYDKTSIILHAQSLHMEIFFSLWHCVFLAISVHIELGQIFIVIMIQFGLEDHIVHEFSD